MGGGGVGLIEWAVLSIYRLHQKLSDFKLKKTRILLQSSASKKFPFKVSFFFLLHAFSFVLFS